MVIYFFFFMLFTEHKVFFVPFCKFQEGLINKFIGDLKHYFNNYILKLNVDMTIECRIANVASSQLLCRQNNKFYYEI